MLIYWRVLESWRTQKLMGFNTKNHGPIWMIWCPHDLGNIQLIRDVGIVLLLSHTFSIFQQRLLWDLYHGPGCGNSSFSYLGYQVGNQPHILIITHQFKSLGLSSRYLEEECQKMVCLDFMKRVRNHLDLSIFIPETIEENYFIKNMVRDNRLFFLVHVLVDLVSLKSLNQENKQSMD